MSVIFDIEWRAAVAVSARCGDEGARALRRLALFVPLFPWLVARALAAWWLGGFPAAPRDELAFLWIRAGGEAATHFPATSALLPRLVTWLDPGLELLFGVFGVMWVCALLPEIYRGEKPSFRAARARVFGHAIAAWFAALPGIVGAGALVILGDVLVNLPVAGLAARGIALVLAVLCRAFFVYAVAAVIIGGVSTGKAWRRSVSLTGSYLGPTLGFVALSFAALWPWRMSPELALRLFGHFTPEWMTAWVAAGALPLVLVTLFVTAATTRLYLHGYGAEVRS